MRRYFIAILILISFCGLNWGNFALAQEAEITLNSKDALSLGERVVMGFYNITIKGPGQVIKWIFKKIWQIIENLWQKIKSLFKREIEEKQPEIKEEFKKETQEIKEGIPEASKSLWQRFRDLIK